MSASEEDDGTRYRPSTVARSPRLGSVIGRRWRLDARLGAGGASTVFAATDRNGERVAIKVLRPDASEATRTRFAQEAWFTRRVVHAGVVRVLDEGESDEGHAFLVMELLQGENLGARRARRARLAPTELVPIGLQLLDVVSAVHAAGVLHRDIKPENVFLANDGRVVLLDFGIARVRDVSGELDDDLLLGTPEFMAPEQALGQAPLIDERSDVFAVGATLWTALAGCELRKGETLLEVLIAACTRQPPPLASVAEDLDPGLAEVIDRAVDLVPHRRWQSAACMAAALRDALALSLSVGARTRPWRSLRALAAPL